MKTIWHWIIRRIARRESLQYQRRQRARIGMWE